MQIAFFQELIAALFKSKFFQDLILVLVCMALMLYSLQARLSNVENLERERHNAVISKTKDNKEKINIIEQRIEKKMDRVIKRIDNVLNIIATKGIAK